LVALAIVIRFFVKAFTVDATARFFVPHVTIPRRIPTHELHVASNNPYIYDLSHCYAGSNQTSY